MEKRLYAIRGASGAENTRESIQTGVADMCRAIFADNGIKSEDLVSIHFTLTSDLTALNPAFALRHSEVGIDVSQCALFSSQEVEIDGSPDHMIRVMVTTYLPEGSQLHHSYVHGAEKLRPDFAKK